MQKHLPTWQLIHQSLQMQIPVMLLYVLESKGSSPGRQGFMMAVNATGQICGSLGGGIMEYKFVELAKSKLKEKDLQPAVNQQIHDKIAAQNQSGMICSGEQTIFLYSIKMEEKELIAAIIDSLSANKNGSLQLSLSGILFNQTIPDTDFYLQKTASDFLLIEKTGYKQNLYIIGAGHCAVAFAQLMSTMDFYIRLFDTREQLNTMEQNIFVQEKKILKDYAELAHLIPSGDNNFIVIMTNGYRTDDIAVRALLSHQFGYIGLLGSKSKIAKMFDSYLAEGIPFELLNKIHAPIGMPINSQTPEEIAVSIAAEIVRVKNIKNQ
jgi:xanthine dehydrogenase accessory factor